MMKSLPWMFFWGPFTSLFADGIYHTIRYVKSGYSWPTDLPKGGVMIASACRAVLAAGGILILAVVALEAVCNAAGAAVVGFALPQFVQLFFGNSGSWGTEGVPASRRRWIRGERRIHRRCKQWRTQEWQRAGTRYDEWHPRRGHNYARSLKATCYWRGVVGMAFRNAADRLRRLVVLDHPRYAHGPAAPADPQTGKPSLWDLITHRVAASGQTRSTQTGMIDLLLRRHAAYENRKAEPRTVQPHRGTSKDGAPATPTRSAPVALLDVSLAGLRTPSTPTSRIADAIGVTAGTSLSGRGPLASRWGHDS